ncbi:MAG TPA: MATE family efflux transporter [Tepidisphaeraceae bacterium]|jgi:MATE family multidrug resistance protein|nr:MATE family efflux transporter [Tepidisphaeraceae bacterium]
MADVLQYSSEPGDRARSPLGELLLLAGPTVAQMASYTLMQFFDTWMLAHVGTGVNEPTAASNGGMIAFSVISIGMGTLFVVNTLVSQAYGRKDYAACGQYLWQGIWFSLGFSVLLLAGLPFLSRVFQGFGHEPDLVRLESLYLKIVLCGSALKLVGTACSQFLVAVNRPGLVLLATLAGVLANVLAAWSMIFGHLGFSRLGVLGSAWGQNVGVFVEMSALIFFATLPTIRRIYNIRDFRIRPIMLATLLKIGIPSGVQIVADVLAWSMYTMWVMGVFGTKIMAANTFIFRFMSVSFMPAFGIGTAVTALVGRYLGRGRPDIARQRADLGFVVCAIYMLSCGLIFFTGRNRLMGLFTSDPEILRTGGMLLIFAAVYQFFDAMYINYNGALRGAGDTFIPAITTAGLCWGITVFGGYAVARLHTSWGPAGPWTVATGYGVILGLFMLIRYRRGKWKAIGISPGDGDAGDFEMLPKMENQAQGAMQSTD